LGPTNLNRTKSGRGAGARGARDTDRRTSGKSKITAGSSKVKFNPDWSKEIRDVGIYLLTGKKGYIGASVYMKSPLPFK